MEDINNVVFESKIKKNKEREEAPYNKVSDGEALHLLKQVMSRFDADGKETPLSIGGSYWRLAKVLRFYLEPLLLENEKHNAKHILEMSGRIIFEDEY